MVLRENRHFMFEEDKTTMFILKFNNLNVKTVEKSFVSFSFTSPLTISTIFPAQT